MRVRFTAFLLIGVVFAAAASAQVVYVDKSNTGAQNGASWATAFTTIQAGIDSAFALGGGEVWVAEGVYDEVRTEAWGAPASVTGSLVLKDGVAVYGGFRGVETALNQRAPSMAVTVIDGSTSRGGSPAYHVVVAGGILLTADPVVIDGFTITGGNAAGVAGDYHTWRGGGLYNWSKTNLLVNNCTFINNSAEVSGGAIANEGEGVLITAAAIYTNCLVVQNQARRGEDSGVNPLRGGGGIYANRSQPTFTHVTVADNTLTNNAVIADVLGHNTGGIYATADPTLGDAGLTTNINAAIFWGNTGSAGGADSGAALNPVGSNMQAVNPVFRAAATVNEPFDYMLTIGVSPDINSVPASSATDISLVPRPIGANADKGCFEMSTNGPVAGCQATTVQLDASGQGSLVVGDVESGSSAEASFWFAEVDQTDFDCTDLGTPAVTVTAYDKIGRSATCNPVVTVEDNIDPVAVGQNATVQLDASGNATLLGSVFDGGSTDNCGSGGLIFTTVPATVDCSDIGAVPVVLTVMDISGNQSSTNVTATVEDNVAPTMICQNITVQLDATGNASIVPADVDNGSNDACGAVTLSLDIDTFDCSDVGTPVTVTLTGEDAFGNSATCQAVVTVEDNVAPTALCQDITVQLDATGNASILPADVDNGSSDVCSAVTLSLDIDTFDCSNVGTPVTVTLTVEDASGNTADCQAEVTVEDVTAPTAICQDTFVYLDGLGNASIVAADVDNGSNDACSVPVLSVTPDTFTAANLGPNTVTLEAEDASGNVGDCTATVLVVDDLNFALDLPAAIGGNAGTPNYSGITVTAAGGIAPYSYVWTYDDGVSPVVLADGPHPADPTVTISGAGSDTLVFSELTTALVGDYSVAVTDDGDPRTINSTVSTLNVTTILEVFLPASVRAYTDFAGPLVLDAIVVNSTPPLTVTWFKDGQPLTVQPGTTSLDLGVPELSEAGDYEVQVIDSDLPPQDVTSNVSVVAIANPLSITVQPVDQNQYESESATFTVTAQDGFPPYAYDWRESAASTGAPSMDSFSLPALTLADDGRSFDVVIADTGSNQTDFDGPLVPTFVTSLAATLSVSAALSIDDQPVGVDVYIDDPPFTLSALYSGGMLPISVVWQREDVDTLMVDQVAGPQAPDTANTVSLTVDPSAEVPGAYRYTAELTDQVRTTSTDPALVTISVPPAVTDNLVDAVGIDGKEFTWSIGVDGGFGTLNIDWKKDDGSKALVSLVDDGRISGQGTTSLTFDPVTFADAGTYQVDISDDGGRMATAGPAQLTIAAGVPVGGVLGLTGLALLSALGGAAAIRRRRQ